MDKAILQSRGATGVVEKPTTTNNDAETPETFTEPQEQPTELQQYRDLAVEAAAPPVRLKLDPPIEYDGKGYSEIICDFDALIGKDFQRCEKEFNHQYRPEKNETPLPEMKHLYHSIVISHAGKVPLGLVFKLPRRYYTPLRLAALKACGSSPDEENP